MASPLFRRKPLHLLQESTGDNGPKLKRVLGPVELTFLGVGAIIGTGIFVLTGTAAAGGGHHMGAGPAIVISFIVTGIACGLAALCYAEFASLIPVSGSAYTYAYASFGELFAWIIGWDLVLEYAVTSITVSIGWSGYFRNLLAFFGIGFPSWLSIDPMTAKSAILHNDPATVDLAHEALATAPHIFGMPILVNLSALIVVFLVTALLVYGIRESARVTSGLVILKLALILIFIVVGYQYVDFDTNWKPFAPNGWPGIMTGAALIFFAYIGFDAVSTTAEEAKNPQRDLPIGMLLSLLICTVLYIAVAAVLTGMVPLEMLANEKPVAAALEAVQEHNIANVISLGAVLSITSVLVVMLYGQTRIFYAMSRDGLLPRALSRVNPRFNTPAFSTILTGFLVAIPAGFIDIHVAAELSNIGTLFAFVLVSGGVLILRVTDPERPRKFRVPFVWIAAPGAIIICFYLMASLTRVTWERFGIWLAIGLVVYYFYGRKKSVLRSVPRE